MNVVLLESKYRQAFCLLEAEQCGWCKDKYGLSWQLVPKNVEELLKIPGAYARMMQMHKLEIDKF